MRKPLLAVAVATLLVATTASPAGSTSGFGDVEAELYYSEAVQWMVDNQITTGTTPTCFSPDAPTTRGQVAAFMHRMEAEPTGAPPHRFVDVVAPWQQEPISWMVANGITTGTSPTTYAPDDQLTRGQLAALLHRLAGRPASGDHRFVDVVAPWQQEPISWMVANGITTGTSPTTYAPDDPVTRCQLAAFLHRYMGRPPAPMNPDSPLCDLTRTPRVATETAWTTFATASGVTLVHPAATVELIGFHESNHDGSQQMMPTETATHPTTMESRQRGNESRSAADIVVDPATEIRSPVTGRVVRGGGYILYCDLRDEFVVIEPDGRPGWEVKVLHIDGLQVATGDRVEAGVTVLASRATQLPFISQVDDLSAQPSWPHVHIEVVDPSIPDRPGRGC